LKERFNLEGETYIKLQDFLNSYTPSKNLLFLLDSKNNFWELVKRVDINKNNIINNTDNLISITSILKENCTLSNRSRMQCTYPKSKFFCIEREDSPRSKLINIEIKDNEISFNKESELEISKITDLNISNLMKDLND